MQSWALVSFVVISLGWVLTALGQQPALLLGREENFPQTRLHLLQELQAFSSKRKELSSESRIDQAALDEFEQRIRALQLQMTANTADRPTPQLRIIQQIDIPENATALQEELMVKKVELRNQKALLSNSTAHLSKEERTEAYRASFEKNQRLSSEIQQITTAVAAEKQAPELRIIQKIDIPEDATALQEELMVKRAEFHNQKALLLNSARSLSREERAEAYRASFEKNQRLISEIQQITTAVAAEKESKPLRGEK